MLSNCPTATSTTFTLFNMGKRKSRAPSITAGSGQDMAAYEAELMGAPRVQARAIPQAIALERGIMPELQSYYFDTLGASTDRLRGFYEQMEGGTIDAQGRYGNALAGMYGQMGAAATQASIDSLDPDARRNYMLMQQQAADDLSLGTELNAQETSIAQGAARAAAQARGLQFSRQGGDLEILNTFQMGQARQNQRRQYAGAALQTAQGVQQFGAQAYLAPAMQGSALYSLPGMVQGAESAMQGYGPRVLQPESQYLGDIRNARLQMQMAADQANATKRAGMMSGIATLGAAAIFACWVAREVYGKDNPKWLVFREWLFTCAPEWLYDLYMEHGERFAKFISDKPLLKWAIRKAMDIAIRRYESQITNSLFNHA